MNDVFNDRDALIDRFRRNRKRGVIVDTNILLLYLIGSFDRNWIAKFDLLQKYAQEDYDTLVLLLRQFDRILTTPNILTEASNLCGDLTKEKLKGKLPALYYPSFVQSIGQLNERYVPSNAAAADAAFSRFGVSDCGIAYLAHKSFLVLTDDSHLYRHLDEQRIDAMNFNHIRTRFWMSESTNRAG